MKKTVLIMAGGAGERFWPKSRLEMPKQFLNLIDDDKSMLQLTVERILPIVDLEDIYIATNEIYKDIVLAQIEGLPEENVICEPVRRNTAPCIGLGAMYINKKYDDALMITLAADHYVNDKELFIKRIEEACEIADNTDSLVTIGIKPNFPETNYGYIKYEKTENVDDVGFKIEKFVEKPNYDLAKEYLNEGNYLWNSGMFVWKLSIILEKIKMYMPETYIGLLQIKEGLYYGNENEIINSVFPTFKSESIDYAIFEKINDMYVVFGDFGWDDVGSWNCVERLKEKDDNRNIIKGNVISIDTTSSILETEDKLMAVIGLENIIAINTEKSILICNKQNIADIKKVLEILKERNNSVYSRR